VVIVKKLAPEYAMAASELKGIVPLAKIDADVESNRIVAQRFGVRGFPTLKVFRDGIPIDYQGDRDSASLVAYMKKQAAPSVTKIDSLEEATEFTTSERVVIVGFFDDDSSEEYTKFSEVAENLRLSYIFGAVIGKKFINKDFGVVAPSIVLFKDFDERKNILDASSLDKMDEFIRINSVPLIDEVGPHNFRAYAESGIPLVFFFIDLDVEGDKEKYVELIRPHAVTSKGKLNWVYIDWVKYSKHSERLGLSGKVVPAIAIENIADGIHYTFDEEVPITADSVGTWISAFLNGKLEPTIKSEEIPENNDGPVKIVVAKTFDEIVFDTTKDVLVEFYAPWCGHCKQLAPVYEQLGTELSSIPSVVVAKIDATANDINPNLGVRGFPTIKLFPANNKQNPIEYDGDRTKEDLTTFIQENAGIKFHQPKEEL